MSWYLTSVTFKHTSRDNTNTSFFYETEEQFDSVALIEGYETWSPEDLADYFEEQGLGDYREVLMYHKIVRRPPLSFQSQIFLLMFLCNW